MQSMAAMLKTQETWIPASTPHPSSCTLPSGAWVRKQHSRTGPQRHAAGVRGVTGACCGVSPPPTHLDEEPQVLVAHTWMGPQELLSHLPQLPLGLLLMGLLQGLEHQGTGHQVEQDQSQQCQECGAAHGAPRGPANSTARLGRLGRGFLGSCSHCGQNQGCWGQSPGLTPLHPPFPTPTHPKVLGAPGPTTCRGSLLTPL